MGIWCCSFSIQIVSIHLSCTTKYLDSHAIIIDNDLFLRWPPPTQVVAAHGIRGRSISSVRYSKNLNSRSGSIINNAWYGQDPKPSSERLIGCQSAALVSFETASWIPKVKRNIHDVVLQGSRIGDENTDWEPMLIWNEEGSHEWTLPS